MKSALIMVVALLLFSITCSVADVETSILRTWESDSNRSPRWILADETTVEVSAGSDVYQVPSWNPSMGISKETWLVYMADFLCARMPQLPSRFHQEPAATAPQRPYRPKLYQPTPQWGTFLSVEF